MATAVVGNISEASVASDRTPRDVSPHTPRRRDLEGVTNTTNGYVSSPLRESQRINSIVDKDLPDVPQEEPARSETQRITNNSLREQKQLRSDSNSFPFDAEPGAIGPVPTTSQLHDTPSSPHSTVRKRLQAGGTETPPEGRRSVQFARGTTGDEPRSLARVPTWEEEQEGNEAPTKERQGSFFGKLRAMTSNASSGNLRNASSPPASYSSPSAALSPQAEHSEPSYPIEPSEHTDADAEADSEDVEDGQEVRMPKKRSRIRRPQITGSESTPSTPIRSRFEQRFASFMREQTGTPGLGAASRPSNVRRNTASDASDGGRGGVSEDEGRDRIRTAWRRGIEGARGLSHTAKRHTENESTETRRPINFRRLTAMMDGTNSNNAPYKHDRQTSSSAQKWKQLRTGLNILRQRKRDERMRVDHQKSAQLMAELVAGAPAALVLASMFQRDEHNHRKIPVLLEQLKIRVSDSTIRREKGDRHLVFRIELEYGNGPARMNWTISRSLQDFINLHVKYQASSAKDRLKHLGSDKYKKARMPRFPKSAFPYARQWRGLFDFSQLADEGDEDEEGLPALPPGPLGEIVETPMESPRSPPAAPAFLAAQSPPTPGPQTPGQNIAGLATPGPPGAISKHKRRKSSLFGPGALRRSSTGEIGKLPDDPEKMEAHQRELYQRRQRKKLETYLQQMIRWLIFRPDSTRLCKFLELSALAIRLSAEGGYQGKQGLLTIASRKNTDMRRAMKPMALKGFADRHRPRWFLVRHSYVVCVDGPESLNPYDVFLVDSDFSTEKRKKRVQDLDPVKDVDKKTESTGVTSHGKTYLIRLYNAERKLRLLARTERMYLQFQDSINTMAAATVWSRKQRFDSFAPVRNNVWCRWLVDGRDHMWQVSRAIDNAKDFVYIHDWWLSPELYMRRPAAISQKWRLDRLLQRKAQEGVKIFVIVYRNIESAIPIDSEYTKWSLLDLHENICIQRSPNQFRQNQFFWAHHEKLVVVDNMMAFVGGIDLCFGRWDDPCHTLVDDKLTGFELSHEGPRDSEHCQVWPGKDYSNPRVQDFYALDRPYEEMYDRTKVPRMPWHDISMQVVGQPARDVGRHFVQRWNYILRSRIPSRPTPVLIPPPEYEQSELEELGMTGTCQFQLLRSCSSWSIGTPNKVEHSIMNAYVHLIEHSKHFVYIENQFFITSCTVEGTPILNKIGDALVERIIRAYEEDEDWMACIVIPLMPGFQNSVDSQDGTSVRLIMQCQFRSICRGETSIFGRLRAKGIDPEDYIRFYSLRQWGKIGPRKCLTTEQLYIHAKCMVVDDRSVIIGSANINERSLLGSRDSEVAAIVTDTRMIPSHMAGQPFEVGEFAHTLRKRLMREHLGIDVDAIYRRDQQQREREHEEQDREMERIYNQGAPTVTESRTDYFSAAPMSASSVPLRSKTAQAPSQDVAESSGATVNGGSTDITVAGSAVSLPQPDDASAETYHEKGRKGSADLQHDLDVEGYGFDNMKAIVQRLGDDLTDSFVDVQGRETLLKKDAPDVYRIKQAAEKEGSRSESREREEDTKLSTRPPYPTERMDTYALDLVPRSTLPELPALDDTDIGGPPLTRALSSSFFFGGSKPINPLMQTMKRPEVHEDCMTDPLASNFFNEIWHQVAENNTKIYRHVFRCMPDNEVLDWKSYELFNEYSERFMQSQGLGSSKPKAAKDAPDKSGPPGSQGSIDGSSVIMADCVADGVARPRSKSVLSNLVEKLRPGSRHGDDPSHTEVAEMKEKDKRQSPDSPESDLSTEHTAVPSPIPDPTLDEKEAEREGIQQSDKQGIHKNVETSNVLNEKSAPEASHTIDEDKPTPNDDAGPNAVSRTRTVTYSKDVNDAPETTATQTNSSVQPSGSQKRRRRGTTKSSARQVPEEVMDREEAEAMLKLVQGHLVLWPYDWLEKEERGGNWLYNIDQLAPLEIYD